MRVSVCFQCFWVFPNVSGCFQCFLGVSQKSWVNLPAAISDASGKITGRPLHKSDRNSWYNLHRRAAERFLELSSCGDCTRKFQEIVPRSRPQLSCGDDDKFFTTHSPGPIQTIVNSKVGCNFCWRNTGHLSQRRDTKHRATPSNTEQHHTFFNKSELGALVPSRRVSGFWRFLGKYLGTGAVGFPDLGSTVCRT